MAGSPITNQVAGEALRKLKAKNISSRGAAHPKFGIFHEGRIVASTGLRHSPKPDIPTPHVNRDLRVSIGFVLDLARCPKDLDDYLRAIGELPPKEQENEGEPKSTE